MLRSKTEIGCRVQTRQRGVGCAFNIIDNSYHHDRGHPQRNLFQDMQELRNGGNDA